MNSLSFLSSLAALLSTLCFIPQVLTILKARDTKSISLLSYLLLSISAFLWLMYGYFTKQNAIFISNTIILSLILKIKNIVAKID